jgi:aspartyl/asparaginyl-tRNA synthetase
MLRRVIADMFKHRLDDLQFFNERVDKQLIERLNGYVARPFVRMTYTEAVKVCFSNHIFLIFYYLSKYGILFGAGVTSLQCAVSISS